MPKAARELHGAQVHRNHRGTPENDDGKNQEDGTLVINATPRPLDELRLLLTQAGIPDAAREAETIWRAAERDRGDSAATRAVEMARERARGTPLAQVTGYTTFMGIDVAVGPGVLIPREETELLGWTAVDLLK